MQLCDVLDHPFGKTGVGVNRIGISSSDFAVTLVKKGGAFEPLLQ